jgi:ubiquinone/menaquinone biosynthesis C-methylase UbiE
MDRSPSPERFLETATAYQRTAALQGAVELDLFTAVGKGSATALTLADRCRASERGIRILCDYLTILGFLVKDADRYALTPDSAAFLDRASPAYLGGTLEFLTSPVLAQGFANVTAAVRRGGTVISDGGTVAREHPIWTSFARAMAPMASGTAQVLPAVVGVEPGRPLKVLDVAAGHGLYGIEFARRHPQAEIVALDWPNVVEVARDNAHAAGVADRFRTLAGSAFDVDYGADYDLILLVNFLHHFDPTTCETLLTKVRAALGEGGRAVLVEFVPNPDRVSPAPAASFSLVMLCSTPAGDAYTFAELERMLRRAGFARNELHPLPPSMEHAIISHA